MALAPHLERLAKDCEITAYRSSGPGGQKKNKTESSVPPTRYTKKPRPNTPNTMEGTPARLFNAMRTQRTNKP